MSLTLLALSLAVVLGLACGGSLRRLQNTRLDHEWLLVSLFILQALIRGPLMSALGDFGVPLWAACSLALLLAILSGIDRPGLALVALGMAMNLLVVLLNGAMPASAGPSASTAEMQAALLRSSGFYVIADARTLLPFLGDVLPIAGGLASLGDVMLAVGAGVFVVSEMVATRRDHDST